MDSPIRKRTIRNQRGGLGPLLIAAIILIAVALGAFALDFAHVLTVKNELQNTADAAALAGAIELAKSEDRGNADTMAAEQQALEVARRNNVDARAVSNDSRDTQVTALATQGLDESDPSTVQVDAQMSINHMLAPIFGRPSDTIMATSIAGSYPQTTVLAPNQAFPMAVSMDQWPEGPPGRGNPNPPRPLNQLKIGDAARIVVRPSASPGRNGVWTSFNISSANTNTYTHLLDQLFGLVPEDPAFGIPALEAGVSRISLDNGINQGTDINGRYKSHILRRKHLVFPVISGFQFNQNVLVRGFVGMKVDDVRYVAGAWVLDGTLVRAIVRGWGGSLPRTGDNQTDQALEDLSTGVVKLLSASSQ